MIILVFIYDFSLMWKVVFHVTLKGKFSKGMRERNKDNGGGGF
jgi:hypothetical protein